MPRPTDKDANILYKLFRFYNAERKAFRWILFELSAKDYIEFKGAHAVNSQERIYFSTVCGFFEFAGVLVNYSLLNQDLFFEVFTVVPYWKKAQAIVYGMREEISPRMYENFELLYQRRLAWEKKHPPRIKRPSPSPRPWTGRS